MSLASLSAHHPVSVIMLYSALMVTGIISLLMLEINMFPEINIPAVTVATECESFSAEDIEKMITIPVENSLSSVKGIKEMSSISKEGLSSVMLKFGWDYKINTTASEIRGKIDTVFTALPFESKKPILFLKNLAGRSILTLSIIPKKGKTISDISSIVEKDLKSRLLSIEGVAEVKLSGLKRDEIKIDVEYPELINTGLPLSAVTKAVSSSVFSNPAGIIFKGTKEYRVRTKTDIRTISDIRNITIPGKEGLKLSDIAEIYTGKKDEYSYFHSDGQECIGIEILKTGDSGLLNTTDRIKKNFALYRKIFKNDFLIAVIDDGSEPLRNALESLIIAILTGIVSAVLVLAYIFRNRKIAFTIIISLPLSLLAVFNFMYFAHISINIISLTGLIIGTGMIFDNTIVVIENLIKEKPAHSEAAGRITSKTVISVSGSTLTTILIFLPLTFISGLAGKLFKDLAYIIIALITSSALVSMTVPPALYMLFDLKNENTELTGRFVKRLKNLYKKYLNRKQMNPVFGVLFFIIPLFLIIVIDKEIVPSGYGKKIQAHIVYNPGYSAPYYSEISSRIEKDLLNSGFVEKIHVKGGVDIQSLEERGNLKNDVNTAVFSITGNSNFKGSSSDLLLSLEDFFTDTDAELKINDSFLDRIISESDGLKNILNVENRERGLILISEITKDLNEVNPGSKISGNFKKTNPEYTLEFNSEGFSDTGLSPLKIGRSLYNSVKGNYAASIDTGKEEETDIVVRYKEIYTDTAEKISALRIPLKEGVFDPAAFIDIYYEKNFLNLTRYNRKPCFYININPSDGNSAEVISHLGRYRAKGLKTTELAMKKNILNELIFLFAAALILVYFFLGAQFESFLIPLVLMLSIPFSISGSFLLLFLTDQSLNISSLLGILILTGTTVNTAIMLFAEIKNNKIPIRKAAEKRIIPATASILTTIAALVPAALLIQNPLQSSSALTLIGGLFAGGLSVLLLYPLIFDKTIQGFN